MVRVAVHILPRKDVIVASEKSKPSKPKRIIKRRKKMNLTGWDKPKRYRPPPGFTAFEVKETVVTPNGKDVVQSRVVSPETGIHSLGWAANIKSQRGFLSLPIEVRKQIYDLLFDGLVVCNPKRHKSKFTAAKVDGSALDLYNALSTASRQIYVDVVGSGMLYNKAQFYFNSPNSMVRYLDCINPAHRESVRNIHLTITISNSSNKVPLNTLPTLSSLPSLSALRLTFRCHESQCFVSHSYMGNPVPVWHPRRTPSYCLEAQGLTNLCKASWGDLQRRLSSFDGNFEGAATRAGYSWHLYFDSQQEGQLEFIEQVAKIVKTKDES